MAPSLRHRPTRTSTLNTLKSWASPRKPARKGLIIAISYKNSVDPRIRELHFPHKDGNDWRSLMISKYNFAEDDITMMLDDEDTPPHLLPTKENILREIKALVEGAQPKDRFMLYFSGHSTQMPSTSYTEVDGLDEAMVTYSPTGHNHPTIIDDTLNELLVEPLPVDAFLTAIFDSCHSGTLLDLEHYTCNSVWFPWCNRGPRDLRKSRWRDVLRKDGLEMYTDEPIRLDIPIAEAVSNAVEDRDERTPMAPVEKPSVRIYERARTGEDTLVKRNITVEDRPPHEKERRQFVITRSSTLEVVRRHDSFLDARKPRRWISFHNFNLMTTLVRDAAMAAFRMPRSTSPESLLPCEGWCKPTTRKMNAQVISIAACQDPQRTWESKDGWTMTQSLISVLDVDPHPPLRELIKAVGHDLHRKTTLKLHAWGERRIAKWNKSGRHGQIPDVEIVNGAEPSLGSSEPLREDAPFQP
ncbi:hypothetical protein L226DRAFT_575567 [Lentinus tigrinus ALCF2SS1-7]|uniref:uncharacterized protein n=1 Tax=Lentinus tigrinus ALCF2SS1-7 TaxID=1328758 RepID=UPI00116632BF|nr:hypothetical protein L226DRAFT_575567 [Lentinus tigrinus ALCF2SS1-7]